MDGCMSQLFLWVPDKGTWELISITLMPFLSSFTDPDSPKAPLRIQDLTVFFVLFVESSLEAEGPREHSQ